MTYLDMIIVFFAGIIAGDFLFSLIHVLKEKKSESPLQRTVHHAGEGIITDAKTVFRAGAGKGKVHVALPCGAKILELDEYEIADTPGTVDRNQPESVRKGGVFFQCYGRCPFCCDCSYVKAFADLHIGKDFSLPLEHGKRLELKRRNGHRCVALVDESDVEVKTIPLTGVSYLGRAERYTTVPPLFQDVEEPRKDD